MSIFIVSFLRNNADLFSHLAVIISSIELLYIEMRYLLLKLPLLVLLSKFTRCLKDFQSLYETSDFLRQS